MAPQQRSRLERLQTYLAIIGIVGGIGGFCIWWFTDMNPRDFFKALVTGNQSTSRSASQPNSMVITGRPLPTYTPEPTYTAEPLPTSTPRPTNTPIPVATSRPTSTSPPPTNPPPPTFTRAPPLPTKAPGLNVTIWTRGYCDYVVQVEADGLVDYEKPFLKVAGTEMYTCEGKPIQPGSGEFGEINSWAGRDGVVRTAWSQSSWGTSVFYLRSNSGRNYEQTVKWGPPPKKP